VTSVNVAGLLHETPGATRDLRLRDHYVSLGPDVELAGPLDADVHLQRTNRGILLRGSVRAPLRRTCARCNDPYVEEVTATFDEEFVPSLDPVTGAPIQPPGAGNEDDRPNLIDGHHEIQLDPILHDELALTEPMHPLCRPDCPGLCVECGERLDRGDHTHGGPEIDPRLAGLAALLPEDDPHRAN
jgi:uncharacterized protein